MFCHLYENCAIVRYCKDGFLYASCFVLNHLHQKKYSSLARNTPFPMMNMYQFVCKILITCVKQEVVGGRKLCRKCCLPVLASCESLVTTKACLYWPEVTSCRNLPVSVCTCLYLPIVTSCLCLCVLACTCLCLPVASR